MSSPSSSLPRPSWLGLAIAVALTGQVHAEALDARSPTDLDALEVHGERQNSYTVPASRAATGLSLSLRQTPQTVSVLTRQQLDDQQIQTLDDVLAAAPGITSASSDLGGRTSYRARGFAIGNYRIDGMQVDGTSGFTGAGQAFNLDLYENVQIVRGANGLLGGTGDPSATVYLQRKRPTKEFGGSVALSAGSWDTQRLSGDLSVPVTASGSVRARVVASGESGDSFRDRETSDRRAALLNLEADLGASTLVNAGYQYEATRIGGASWGANVPIWFADGSLANLPRSTNPVADWSVAKREASTVFAALEHAWENGWTLRAGASRTESDAYGNYGIAKPNNLSGSRFGGFWNQDGSGAHLNAFHSEGDGTRDNLDVSLRGPLQLGGRSHELMLGFNGYEDRATSYTFNRALGNCVMGSAATYTANACQFRAGAIVIGDWRGWDGSAPELRTFRTSARTIDTTRVHGGYLAGRFDLADPLDLIIGARLSRYETWRDTYTATNARSRGAVTRERDVLTPYAGIVYTLSAHYSLYASYTDVFTPQGDVRDASDRRLDPLTGQSAEIGIKGEFADGRVNASFALYRNLQDGLAESTNRLHPDTGLTIYRAVDGVKSRGAELEVNGSITPRWNISGGYTWLDVDGLGYQRDPRHQLRLNTAYTLPGAFDHLTLGGGVSVQSRTEWSTYPGRPLPGGSLNPNDPAAWDAANLLVGGHTRLNLMARYALSERLELALNVSNVTDKTHYAQYGFYDGLIYAEPRNTTLTLRARF
ncbi:TonB-dependent siderophore receptor [Xanthomonas sp. XNM01]|uniref:TonB-dependent siderophore receptor n=1 Tax=Xanthomonas sp. XNM01 TaxID=2769289 RepID=UPI00178284D9|nr:TonB-dependent siderophore receptor [Xanthomonas sp. XNM01]MBD9367327.1 TonB-dependent siderophore receptor [Xanthomonas sp. XNM01]